MSQAASSADEKELRGQASTERPSASRPQFETQPLTLSAEEHTALLDNARDAIVVHDLEGRIVFWNKGAERIYGWTQQESIGKHIDLLYVDPQKFEESHAITLEKGEWNGDARHISKDNRELIMEARWTVMRDRNGRPKSVIGVKTDVTEKRAIEVQFIRAQRMASLGLLAGGIAHDLNNVLTPIMLSIDVLKNLAKSNPEAASVIETIEMSTRRGSDIVQQVLSFARGMEGQRIVIQPKYLLQEIEHIVRDTFPKDVRLQVSLPHDAWTIIGDPTQIQQVLLNLCVNARDAMPTGGTLVIAAKNCIVDEHYVAMNKEATPGMYVSVSVTDSGTGISDEIVEKIFEPFFTTKPVGKGTGLGLSSVQAIVRSHGGFIDVYSEIGRGTTFKIYFPAQASAGEVAEQAREETNLPRGNGETILVVDDEPNIVSITQQTLEAFGYKMITAQNGAEAVAFYAQNREGIAVILTDLSMPVMDGRATIYALLKINPKAKIVAMSGMDESKSTIMAANAGIKHFISKPYTAGTLLKTMRDVIAAN